MAHEVEKMTFKGDVPWHGLGTNLTGTETFDQIIQLSGLDWTVSARSLYVYNQALSSRYEKSEDSKLIVRDTDSKQLGTVGAEYKVIQHTDALRRLVEPYINSGQVDVESAGSLRDGKKVWMLAKLRDSVAEVKAGDEIKAYLLFATAHDGSMAALTKFTNTRVVCANTLAMAQNSSGAQMRVRHKGQVNEAMELVAKTLDIAKQDFAATMEQYKRLSQLDVSATDLDAYFRVTFNIPNEVESKDSRLLSKLTEIFETAQGQDVAGANMWGAYNAVTHYLTHERGNTRDGRLSSLWLGQSNVINQKALTLALEAA